MIESNEFEYCKESGKRCYSKKNAEFAIHLARKTARKGHKVPVRCYLCEYCRAYHLTSKYLYQKSHNYYKNKKN